MPVPTMKIVILTEPVLFLNWPLPVSAANCSISEIASEAVLVVSTFKVHQTSQRKHHVMMLAS